MNSLPSQMLFPAFEFTNEKLPGFVPREEIYLRNFVQYFIYLLDFTQNDI